MDKQTDVRYMKTDTADNAIVYGNIFSLSDRESFEKNCNGKDCMLWKNSPDIYGLKEGLSWIFIDLDDPLFSDPQFIMSLATAGEKVKLIGKVTKPDTETSIRMAKFGMSEIISPDQCLEKMHKFLQSLQTDHNDVQNSVANNMELEINAMVGDSPKIREIKNTINALSAVDFPSALLLGETGTGKGLLAKIIHKSGVRRDHNLVEVNCSAIPDELFESELFGHVKGAFTDAKTEKRGLFDYAQNGTLFFDEIGNLSSAAQAKLLKILEDRKLRKVGAVNEESINVRVLAATNLDLHKAVEDGRYREDLYYRLNLLTIEIPPLRERREDIPELVEYFLGYYGTNYTKPNLTFTRSALDFLTQYNWPGNVRELCNVIERAVLLAKKNKLNRDDIEPALKGSRLTVADRRQIVLDIPPQGISLEEIELTVVKQVLNMCGWNKSEASRFLGISRPRLRRILNRAEVEQNRRLK